MTFEVVLQVALILTVLPFLPRSSRRTTVTAATTSLVLLYGVFSFPTETATALAVIHNFTPLAFFAENPRSKTLRHWRLFALLVFGALPVLSAVLCHVAVDNLLFDANSPYDYFGLNNVSIHLGAFVPAVFQNATWALPFFAAVAFLQVAHYFSVIHLLPRLLPTTSTQLSTLPRFQFFRATVMATATIMSLYFFCSFVEARAVYGIAAAIHAFIEFPVLFYGFASQSA